MVLRPTDLFGRYGGEELVLLLPETAPHQACALAEGLCRAVAAATIAVDDSLIGITASFGAAGMTPIDDTDLDSLLRDAGLALYQAKEAGRSRVVLAAATKSTVPEPEKIPLLRG